MFNLESAVQPVVCNVDRGAVKFSRVEFDGSLQNLPKLLQRIARSGGGREGGDAATFKRTGARRRAASRRGGDSSVRQWHKSRDARDVAHDHVREGEGGTKFVVRRIALRKIICVFLRLFHVPSKARPGAMRPVS